MYRPDPWAIVHVLSTSITSLSPCEVGRMDRSVETLHDAVASGRPVYGTTHGFGPLVAFPAAVDGSAQGLGLINHLAVGQDPPLRADITRLMLWLRLAGMRQGFSGVAVDQWQRLAALWKAGVIPVVPARGTVSASGDLMPLAHAALALAGDGEVWSAKGSDRRPALSVMEDTGTSPIRWRARDALAFVNGGSASLAVALYNHVDLTRLAWAVCALTGRVVSMLGCSLEPYAPEVAIARGGSAGHEQAVEWIREHSPSDPEDQRARALQEPYSVRCVPQIVGAVLDFLGATGSILVTEALGTSDNPVVVDGSIFHAGNFHAISSGLASDLMSSLVHQLAFVAERQLSLLLDPATNGGRNPFLAPDPGATSGLAGVQLAATAMLAEIRQLCLPSTTTALATNLGNQDVVPMSLNGAIKVRGQIELANLIVASHALVVTHYGFDASIQATSKLWASLADATAPLTIDRPLAADVRLIRDLLLEASTRPCASMGADLGFG